MTDLLSKPLLYRDWVVFPDTIFSDLDLTDCNDTTDGVCRHNLSLKECIDYTISEENSDSGYYVAGKNISVCVPIYTTAHKDLNPSYRLRNKTFYSSLDGYSSYSFINSKKYKYPPDIPNTIFYEDYFNLENIDTGLSISFSGNNKNENENDNIDTKSVDMSDTDKISLQAIPFKGTRSSSQLYIPINDKIPLLINIPSTNLVLIANDNNELAWGSKSLVNPQIEDTFSICSVDGHSPLFFGDKVYILYQKNLLVYMDKMSKKLGLLNLDYETAVNKNYYVNFKLTPQVEAFYCNNNKECKPISLSETKTDKYSSVYNNSKVSRNPVCWGLCGKDYNFKNLENYFSSKKWSKIILIVLSVLIILIFLIFLIVIRNRKSE